MKINSNNQQFEVAPLHLKKKESTYPNDNKID